MGAHLLLMDGKKQHSPESVVHLISERFYDRSSEVERLSEDGFKHQMHRDQTPPPPVSREIHRHPRKGRIIPKSRNFH